jgi:uncharacterized Ntn-hydrolase superfamily protein
MQIRKMSWLLCLVQLSLVSGALLAAQQPASIATFSIVAHDPETGDFGVAVQSKYFDVGSVVPHARANAGAIATQAMGNIFYGYEGLALLEAGVPASEVLEKVMAGDPKKEFRQVGLVDQQGRAVTFTGSQTLPWSGGRTGEGYAVQGNLLAGAEVVNSMAAAFESASGELAQRLLLALSAGQSAGGDSRGRQSAALLVVRPGAGYMGANDRLIELDVEDHPAPIRELTRLLDIRRGQLLVAESLSLLGVVTDDHATPVQREAANGRARELATSATQLYPGNGDAWLALAEAERLAGDTQAASDAFKAALIVNPQLKRYALHPGWGMVPAPVALSALLELPGVEALWEALPEPPQRTATP